jgi:hypothetical protein
MMLDFILAITVLALVSELGFAMNCIWYLTSRDRGSALNTDSAPKAEKI